MFLPYIAPASIDPPITVDYASRTAALSWSVPSQTNGVITNYTIYSNDTLAVAVHSNITTTSISGLSPFTMYVFTVGACTIAGCVTSDYGRPIVTLEDGTYFLVCGLLANSKKIYETQRYYILNF